MEKATGPIKGSAIKAVTKPIAAPHQAPEPIAADPKAPADPGAIRDLALTASGADRLAALSPAEKAILPEATVAPPKPAPNAPTPSPPVLPPGFWEYLVYTANSVAGEIVNAAKGATNDVVTAAHDLAADIVRKAENAGRSVSTAIGTNYDKLANVADNVRQAVIGSSGKAGAKLGLNLVKRKIGPLWTRRIVQDRSDANPSALDPGGLRRAARARKVIAKNEARASATLANLTEAGKAQYQRVFDAAAGDSEAQADLQKLLISGKLPGSAARGGDKGSLLAQLDTLATQPLADGIDRSALVADTIQEIADPARINQHTKGTCVATVASILLAKVDSAEYIRLVAGLAMPEGKVLTAGGHTLAREADWQSADGNRSISARLLQPAFMEFANGEADYDNTADQHSDGLRGLSAKNSEALLETVMGRQYDTLSVPDLDTRDLEATFEKLKSAVKGGEKVPVGLLFSSEAHKVLVERISGDRIYYTNPWGKQESLSLLEFKTRLQNVNLLQD